MSYTVSGTNINLTRGDTLEVQIGIMRDGEEYTPVEGDVIRFAMKHASMTADKTAYTDANPLVEKVIPNDTLVLELEPSDTEELPFGKYVYDIQITFASGQVDTFISGKLKLLPSIGSTSEPDPEPEPETEPETQPEEPQTGGE